MGPPRCGPGISEGEATVNAKNCLAPALAPGVAISAMATPASNRPARHAPRRCRAPEWCMALTGNRSDAPLLSVVSKTPLRHAPRPALLPWFSAITSEKHHDLGSMPASLRRSSHPCTATGRWVLRVIGLPPCTDWQDTIATTRSICHLLSSGIDPHALPMHRRCRRQDLRFGD